MKLTYLWVSLVTGMPTVACRPATSQSPIVPAAAQKDMVTMTSKFEARIVARIEAFESTRRRTSAEFAAFELVQPDPFAPMDSTAEEREHSRDRRVALWGRLFCAVDALLDPEFDPEQEPPYAAVSIDEADMPDRETYPYPIVRMEDLPADVQKKYADRLAKLQAEAAWNNQQYEYHRIDLYITERAEEFFKSAFVRSAKSVSIVERHAASQGWTKKRENLVVSWVRPLS